MTYLQGDGYIFKDKMRFKNPMKTKIKISKPYWDNELSQLGKVSIFISEMYWFI